MKNINGSGGFSFFLFLLILLVCFVSPVAAGFNDTMDMILSQEQLTFGAASFLVLVGSGIVGDDISVEAAADKMSEMAPKVVLNPDEPVTIGEYSYLIMTAYDIKGGLFYTIFGNPRYALRELRFLDIVQGRAYSRMYLPGERAVRILGRVGSEQES